MNGGWEWAMRGSRQGACVRACVRACARVRVWCGVREQITSNLAWCVRVHVCVCMRACVRACVQASEGVCMCVRARVCVVTVAWGMRCACVRVYVCVRAWMCPSGYKLMGRRQNGTMDKRTKFELFWNKLIVRTWISSSLLLSDAL